MRFIVLSQMQVPLKVTTTLVQSCYVMILILLLIMLAARIKFASTRSLYNLIGIGVQSITQQVFLTMFIENENIKLYVLA